MKVIDAHWDTAALGLTTIEIEIEPGDRPSASDIESLANRAEHTVVKATGPITLVHDLEDIGFRFMESQLSVRKALKGFEISRVDEIMLGRIGAESVSKTDAAARILAGITDTMFATDRISVDPEFGPEIAATRYRAWLQQMHASDDHELVELLVGHETVGFSAIRTEGSVLVNVLGGVFDHAQGTGTGVAVVGVPLAIALDRGLTSVRSRVSTNNPAIVRIYGHFGFSVDASTYVLRRIRRSESPTDTESGTVSADRTMNGIP